MTTRSLDLEAIRRRDRDALGTLFEVYFDRLFALLYRLLGHRSAAEDAIQEVFLKVHHGASTLDPRRDPGPWLVTIATNVCRDYWRSGLHRLVDSSTSIDDNLRLRETLAQGTPDPEQDAAASERAALVQAAILRLPEAMRVVVVLRVYEGLDYDEIAAALGTSEAAARKRFSRGLDRLGKILRGRGL